jgi:hypothetical protein
VSIYNDYKALDAAIQKIRVGIENLNKVKKDLIVSTDRLHNEGFTDKKFLELKAVMDSSDKNLAEIQKGAEMLIAQLEQRSKLIKAYYEVMR